MLSPQTHARRPGRVYAADTMLRRESGQILPGLIVLMLAILALGVLAFTVGKAAVLRSGAQTAADAAALAGARSIKQQLIAQMASTGTADFARVSEPVVRAAAADYAKRNGARLTDMKMEGADVRAWVSTNEKIDPPKEDREGKARGRARVELVTFQSLGLNFSGGGGAMGGGTGNVHITDKEWKELEKDLHKPLDCPDMRVLADFFKKHGAIPPFENVYMGDPPMAPGGERDSTSRHYACDNSGAIDLNYPQGIEASVIEEVRPHLIKLGFFTMWQVENHYDHMHVDFGGGVSPTPGSSLGAAGSLTDSFLEIKLIDWEAPTPIGLASQFVGGAGGIPFGPPDPKIAIPLCQELDRFNVSAKVRLAAWETAIVESGVKIPPTNDGTSLGPFQQIANGAWGTAEQRLDPHHSAAAFIRAAQKIEHRYPDAGTLAQGVQGSDFPDRYGQRAGQAAALNDKFCGGK
jgi:putative Flp pilus-assembly TadE/G-like protein